jgi:hypothetical protein
MQESKIISKQAQINISKKLTNDPKVYEVLRLSTRGANRANVTSGILKLDIIEGEDIVLNVGHRGQRALVTSPFNSRGRVTTKDNV